MSIPNKNKGFTLVEILLVVAIMGVLSVTAIISVTETVSRMQFQSVVDKVEQMVFDARSMALSGKQIVDCGNIDHDKETDDFVVAAGYGLHVDTVAKKFIVFDDFHDFLTGTYVPLQGESCGDIVESEYTLPDGEFSVETVPAAENFVYLPPDAVFKANQPSSGNYEIKISNDKFEQTITIGLAGVPGRGELKRLNNE